MGAAGQDKQKEAGKFRMGGLGGNECRMAGRPTRSSNCPFPLILNLLKDDPATDSEGKEKGGQVKPRSS